MRWFFPLFLFFALSACNGASIATQWRLRNFDMATADLAKIRFALAGPDWTRATPEKAVVEVSYQRDGDDESNGKTMSLRLQKAAHGEDREALEKAGGAPRLAVIELAPASLAVARAAQQETLRLRTEGAKTRGRLRFTGALGCRRGDIPPGPVPIDVFIHADDEIGWLPLYNGFDARGSAKDETELREQLPPCPEPEKTR